MDFGTDVNKHLLSDVGFGTDVHKMIEWLWPLVQLYTKND